jgi:hypothetical protein
MKKRSNGVIAAAMGTPLVAFGLYAFTHPAVMVLAMLTPLRVSDRDAKGNLQPVKRDVLLHQVARLSLPGYEQ